MSRARLMRTGVMAAGLVVLGAVAATSWLPLHAQATRLRAGGAIKPPTKIHDVRPVYPDDAKAAGVEGVVIQQIAISTEGSVIETSLLRSVPMLDDAARNAVLQWRFEPTWLNGEPVEIEMVVTVNFTLSK